MNKKIVSLVILLLVVIVAIGGYWFFMVDNEVQQVACTMEAKICPDGSSVGRTGPKCEFVACPEVVNQPVTNHPDWATYYLAGQNIQFKYPTDLQVEYITPQDWPPQITVKTGQFICNAQDGSASLPTRTLKKIYNNNTYCIEAMSEGAAGSVYTTYTYTTQKDSKLISVKFTLRFPQCLNYDDPKKTACQNERTTFDLDSLVDQIINTIKPAIELISDLLKVTSPAVNAVVSSPLKIVGQARGTYFFEASFPIELKDQDGNIIGQAIAQAKSDWMTENFVPFEAKLTFDKPNTKIGRLILKKDNPSGLPQNDLVLEIPILIK